MRYNLLLSVSCASLAMLAASGAASAQSETEAPEDSVHVLQEVVVTATRRAEKLSEVPISMSVVGAGDIEQTSVRELSELTGTIPNVSISGHNDFRSVITIRGVGSASRNIGFDSRVGVYVDGVYMGQSPAVNQELLDLERVEVLRGPQGMLFGKNTVAGAISLVTKKPTNEFSGKLSASLGNFNSREIQGMVNVPLAENLAAKVSVSKTDRDGYIKNIITGNDLDSKDVLAYRAQLRYDPTDKFEVNFAYDGLQADNKILVGEPLTDMLGTRPAPIAPKKREVAFDFDPQEDRDVSGAMLDAEYKLDSGFALKSITGYRDTDAFYMNATDYSPVSIIYVEYSDKFEQLTQEFQLISPANERLTYMAGLYYYKQDADTERNVTLGDDFNETFIAQAVAPSVAPLLGLDPSNLTEAQLALIAGAVGFGPEGSVVFNSGTVATESYAAYLNGSFDITDRWTLGFGGRYSVEDKDVNWLFDGRNSGVFNLGSTNYDPATPSVAPSPLINSRQDTFFSPAISLSYALSGDANVYAKYSSGYKSGGFNLDFINKLELAANSGLEFGKETVDSYEAGLKSTLLGGRMTLNLAAFLSEYDDYQVNQFVDLGGGRTSIRITNAAKVITKGIEADFNFQATENFGVQGTLGILNAEFDSFPDGGTFGEDASGKKLPNAPEITASISGTYMRDLPALSSSLLARLDVTYSDGYFTTIDNIKYVDLPSGDRVPFGYIAELTQLNGRIGLLRNKEDFEVYLWGRNLTDEDAIVDDFRDFFGTLVNHPNIGRTYGIELVAKF
ncbi:TonB-dependent receptor [Hyphomonas oceanitis]|uniref:TonB-dependent receptor n=1 Tax=Hyphomonas oceanitis TaxID=81033 RepID=UPI0030038EAB